MVESMEHYKYMSRLETVHSNLRNLTQVLRGFQIQSDVRASYEEFGMSKATWRAIKNIPAVRGMVTISAAMENLAGIDEAPVVMKPTKVSKTAVISDWLDNTADGVNNFVVTSKYHLDGLLKSIDDSLDLIESRGSIDENDTIYAISAQQRLEQCDHLKQAHAILVGLEPTTNPGGLEAAMEHLSHVSGMCKMGYDNQPGPSGMYCVEDLQEGTLGSLGYNYETILSLGDDIGDLLEDAITLIKTRGEALADQLTDKSDEVRSVNDTPAESTGEGVVDEADVSQEEEVIGEVNTVASYTSAIVCELDCVGHIALNFLSVLSQATGQ